MKLTREQWLRAINQRSKKQHNRRLVRTKANDPNWLRLGDYYMVDTETGRIVCRHYDFASFAKDAARRLRVR